MHGQKRRERVGEGQKDSLRTCALESTVVDCIDLRSWTWVQLEEARIGLLNSGAKS